MTLHHVGSRSYPSATCYFRVPHPQQSPQFPRRKSAFRYISSLKQPSNVGTKHRKSKPERKKYNSDDNTGSLYGLKPTQSPFKCLVNSIYNFRQISWIIYKYTLPCHTCVITNSYRIIILIWNLVTLEQGEWFIFFKWQSESLQDVSRCKISYGKELHVIWRNVIVPAEFYQICYYFVQRTSWKCCSVSKQTNEPLLWQLSPCLIIIFVFNR